jgi:hypothetical protein
MFKKLAGLTAIAGLFVAGTASAEILNSSHDLSAEVPSLDDICTICHAPHANESAGADGLLWNHTPSTAGAYTPYGSDTLNGTSSGPGPVSTLCLSCHDGSVSVDSFGGVTRSLNITNAAFTNGGPAFGTSLADDHPIGITYEATDTELAGTGTAINFNNGAAAAGETIADLLFGAGGNVVECGSCHDVHNTDSSASTAGQGLLRVANDSQSSLCTTCHLK